MIMKFDENLNYAILSNNIDNIFLEKFSSFKVIGSDISYQELVRKLEFFPNKQIVFKETWHNLKNSEIAKIIELLKQQNIKYINITSNIEECLLADYIMVYDNHNLVLSDTRDKVLKEEKKLKKLGFGLPFVVDLSTQLGYYDVLYQIYYNSEDLIGALWN